MTWNNLTYAFESQLNTIKMGQLMENFAAMAAGDSGAPRILSAALSSSCVTQGKLGTTTASGSAVISGHGSYTLAGGTYSWWTAGMDENLTFKSGSFGGSDTSSGVLGLYSFSSDSSNVYIDERYIQASPPYNLGDGDVALFVFLLMNRNGSIAGSQIAQDPPWANNGPTCLTPHKIDGGRKYRCYKRLGFGGPLLAELTEAQKLAYAKGELDLVEDWVEITQEWKNRDRHVVPHPFGRIADDQTVVLVDPFNTTLIDRLRMLQESVGAREVRELFLDGDVAVDNERTQMRGVPRGVTAVRARLR